MKKKKTSFSFGVIGLGRFGDALARSLSEAGREVVVIDNDENKIKKARLYTDHAYVVGSLSRETLEEVGIQNCDTVIVCIGEQIDVSILTTLNCVSLGVDRVIAKATSQEQGFVLKKLGAEVVYPENDMAIRLARRLTSTSILEYINLSQELDISELLLTDKLNGKTVAEADIRKRFGLNIIAVERAGNTTIEIGPSYRLSANDVLVVVGQRVNIQKFERWLQ